ncbi:MAG: bifunctional non-ous end joining protein LigD, partial [Pseudonocardia sp.]
HGPRDLPPQARLRPDPRARRCSGSAGRASVRRAAPSLPAPALRLPPRARRRARQLGRTAGADAGPEGPPHRRSRRGPSRGVRRLPAGTVDPAEAIAGGEIHLHLHGDKLAGRFVLVRRGSERGREQWLMVHKNDDHAVGGWDPEEHPHSVRSGCTNDEVAEAPAALWQSDTDVEHAEVALDGPASWDPPTPDELAALDGLRSKGRWSIAGRELTLTNLDKGLFPGCDGEPPVTKRDLIRYYAQVGPGCCLPRRPAGEHAPLPRRRRPAGLLAQGGAEPRARVAGALAQPGSRPGGDRVLRRSRRAAGARVARRLRDRRRRNACRDRRSTAWRPRCPCGP